MVDIVEEIKKIKIYAKENNVPIIEDDSLQFLTTYILKNRVKKVLEVGTAIGYSAIMMALTDKDVSVVTIERNKERYFEAIKNIKKFGLEDRITLVYNDCFEVNLTEKFDLIFIDAAKSKNKQVFEHFEGNLNPNGRIITDNLNFHGCVKKDLDKIESKNVRGLVIKIRDYIEFLKNNPRYITTFYEIGDGLSVSERNDII